MSARVLAFTPRTSERRPRAVRVTPSTVSTVVPISALTTRTFTRRVLTASNAYRWLTVIRRDVCVYCAGAGGTAEHVRPRHHGGANHSDNRAGACLACNHARGSYPLLRFLVLRRVTQNWQLLSSSESIPAFACGFATSCGHLHAASERQLTT